MCIETMFLVFDFVFLQQSDSTQNAAYVHGKRNCATSAETRIAIEEFGNCTYEVGEEVFLKDIKLTLNVAYAAHLVDAQVSFEIEACEPRPCRALMVGIVTTNLLADIERIVAAALRRE